mgnify:CR=1 FL=1
MAEHKKTFIFYSDWINMVSEMPNEDAGELLKHILGYVNDNKPETKNLLVKMAFGHMKPMLKADLIKWDGIREKRKEYGKKGGEAKAKQNIANAKQLEAVNDNDNVNVNVNDKVNDNKEKKKPKGISNLSLIDFPKMQKEIFELWEFWVAYKWEQHKQEYKSSQSELIALRKFWKDYTGDFEKMKAAVENSISSLYKGIFAPDEKKKQLNKTDF